MVDKLRLEVLLAAVDKVTGPLRKMAVGSKATSSAIGETEAALKRLQSQQRLLQKLENSKPALIQERDKLRVLNEQMAAMRAQGTASKKQMADKQREIAQQATAYERQRAAVMRLRTEVNALGLGKVSLAQTKLASDIAATNTQLDAQKRKFEQQRQVEERLAALRDKHATTMTKLGMWGATAAGGMMAGQKIKSTLMPAVNTYADAEDAQSQLKVSFMQADGSVVPEYEHILALANKLGDRLPGTTADFTKMFTVLRKEGMTAQAVLGGLGVSAANLGVLLKVAPDEAAAKMAKMQDSLRATEKEMPEVADLMQRANYLGADMAFMQSAMGNAAPVMDVMKVQGAEAMRVLAPMAVMMNQAGMEDGGSVGNAVRKIYDRAMSKKKVGKANEALKKAKAGFNLDFTDGKGEFGGMAKLFKQLDKLRALSTQTRGAVINELWGDDAETNRVLTKWINDNLAGYEQTVQKMQEQADLQTRVNEQLSTLNNVADAAGGAYSNLLKELGASIAPEIKQMLNLLGDLAAATKEWVVENPRLVKTLMLIAAGLAAVLTIGGALGMGLIALLGPMLMLRFLSARFALNLLGIAAAGGKAGAGAGVAARGVAWLVAGWQAFRKMGVAGMLTTMSARAVAAFSSLRTMGGIVAVFKTGLIGLFKLVFAFARANPLTAIVLGIAGVAAGVYAHWDKIKEYFKAGEWWSLAKEIGAALEWGLNAATLGMYEFVKTMVLKAYHAAKSAVVGLFSSEESSEPSYRKWTPQDALGKPGMDTLRPGAGDATMAPMLAMAPAASAAGPTITTTNNISVTAAPGMDEKAVARAVSFEIDRQNRAKAARMGSALYDTN
ncbi:phage tail tape measure protein [Comamonas sp. MYb21]|uniref:phage tail tape measure protein n=1 Tax=Comamonas sp. MYb21 TaxID=1848648 RepID=UPI0030B62E7F